MAQEKQTVSFTRMDEGTTEDYAIIAAGTQEHRERFLVDNVLRALRSLDSAVYGFPISVYEHSLQTATRAVRDGARDDLVVAALLHDLGDVLAPGPEHAAMSAAVIRPYVDEEAAWIVEHHGVFQGYHFWDKIGMDRDSREAFRSHPYFDATAYFCAEWDQTSFDPKYRSMSIDDFLPLLSDVFGRRPGKQTGAQA